MTRVRRSRTKGSAKDQNKSQKTKRYSRDIDQILADAADAGHKRQTLEKGWVQDPEEISGGGLHPCQACDRHFIDSTALEGHLKSKIHRRRLKQLREGFSGPKEAEEAIGRQVDNKQKAPRTATAISTSTIQEVEMQPATAVV